MTSSPFSYASPRHDASEPSRGQSNPPLSTHLEAPILPVPGEANATYKTALRLVQQIDRHVSQGTRHYRNRAGELLTTLDSVIQAILENNLLEQS